MIPHDPNILLSFINLKLRDDYPSLAALCDDLQLEEAEITATLAQINYRYLPEANQFK